VPPILEAAADEQTRISLEARWHLADTGTRFDMLMMVEAPGQVQALAQYVRQAWAVREAGMGRGNGAVGTSESEVGSNVDAEMGLEGDL
jgi:hypothetical protein